VSYVYNAGGQRTSMTLPGARTVQYAYDTAGRLASTTRPGGAATTYTGDPLGRVTKIDTPAPAGTAATQVFLVLGPETDARPISRRQGARRLGRDIEIGVNPR